MAAAATTPTYLGLEVLVPVVRSPSVSVLFGDDLSFARDCIPLGGLTLVHLVDNKLFQCVFDNERPPLALHFKIIVIPKTVGRLKVSPGESIVKTKYEIDHLRYTL